ncbi:MAG: N-6 DNA methylase [Candidatus Scalindua sp.]|nr:N-6 DNA methylase [Candidatus Scalindua sp.]
MELERKKVATYIIDPSLSKLIVKLLNPQPLERLDFPFSGLGQISTTAMDHICDISKPSTDDIEAVVDGRDAFCVRFTHIKLSGEEKILALVRLRIAAKAYSLNKNGGDLTVGFVVHSRPDDYSKPDIIFLNTPFGCKRPSLPTPIYQAYEIPILNIPHNKRGLLETFHYLDSLSDSGRMCALIPIEPLSSASRALKDMSIKEYIIENNYLEAVIQLPEQPPFSGTAMTPVLLVINKNKSKSRKHKTFFAKLKPVRQGSSIVSDAEANRVLKACNNTNDNADAIVTLEDIQLQNYNLSPDVYIEAFTRKLKKLIENKQAVHLRELCTIEVGRARRIDLGGAIKSIGEINPCLPFVEAKNLAKDVTDPYLDLNGVYKGIEIKDHHVFDKKCILITRIGLDLKPTIFDPDYQYNGKSNKILLGFSIAALIPNEKIVDFEYLYYQLHSPMVKKQRKSSFSEEAGRIHHREGRGSRNPLHYLEELVIPVLSSLEDQRTFVEQQKLLLFEIENTKLEAIKARLNIPVRKQEAEYEIVRHLAHDIKPKINIVGSPLRTIYDFLNKEGLLDKEVIVRLNGTKATARDVLKIAIEGLRQITGSIPNFL